MKLNLDYYKFDINTAYYDFNQFIYLTEVKLKYNIDMYLDLRKTKIKTLLIEAYIDLKLIPTKIIN